MEDRGKLSRVGFSVPVKAHYRHLDNLLKSFVATMIGLCVDGEEAAFAEGVFLLLCLLCCCLELLLELLRLQFLVALFPFQGLQGGSMTPQHVSVVLVCRFLHLRTEEAPVFLLAADELTEGWQALVAGKPGTVHDLGADATFEVVLDRVLAGSDSMVLACRLDPVPLRSAELAEACF